MSLGPTYTVKEVAASIRASEWFVRDRVKKGVVRPLRIGNHKRAEMRFTEADVQTLIRALTPAPPPRRRRVA